VPVNRARALLLAPLLVLALALPLAACSSSNTTQGSAGQGNGNTATSKTGGLLSKRVTAPTLSGATIGGGTLSTASYQGSVVVVNFYASWCAPCVAETPLLEQVAQSDPGVHFVGVLFKDTAANGASFRRAHDITYPSLIDTDGVDLAKFRNVDPSAVPVTFVIDKQGKVAARYVGGIASATGLQQVLSILQAQT
jgi:thiol-disulfide isomerase/thioredoxin